MRSLLLVVVVAGCGSTPASPRPGDPCDGGEPFTCFSSGTRGVCERNRWLEYPCDGTFGLRDGGTYVGRCLPLAPQQCLMPVPVAGDFCPTAFEGKFGRCMSNSFIAQCRGESWKPCVVRGCEDVPENGDERNGIASTFSNAPDSGCGF